VLKYSVKYFHYLNIVYSVDGMFSKSDNRMLGHSQKQQPLFHVILLAVNSIWSCVWLRVTCLT